MTSIYDIDRTHARRQAACRKKRARSVIAFRVPRRERVFQAAMLDHVAHDELVGWGWDPGLGRAPVPIPRAEVAAAFRTWMDAGAPCPAR